jgi:hypothetical protein
MIGSKKLELREESSEGYRIKQTVENSKTYLKELRVIIFQLLNKNNTNLKLANLSLKISA